MYTQVLEQLALGLGERLHALLWKWPKENYAHDPLLHERRHLPWDVVVQKLDAQPTGFKPSVVGALRARKAYL